MNLSEAMNKVEPDLSEWKCPADGDFEFGCLCDISLGVDRDVYVNSGIGNISFFNRMLSQFLELLVKVLPGVLVAKEICQL